MVSTTCLAVDCKGLLILTASSSTTVLPFARLFRNHASTTFCNAAVRVCIARETLSVYTLSGIFSVLSSSLCSRLCKFQANIFHAKLFEQKETIDASLSSDVACFLFTAHTQKRETEHWDSKRDTSDSRHLASFLSEE